jgi:hypothetical protein
MPTRSLLDQMVIVVTAFGTLCSMTDAVSEPVNIGSGVQSPMQPKYSL